MDDKDYLSQLLEESHKLCGTDLHLCPGSKPLIRINGSLVEMPDKEMIKPDNVTELLDGILDNRRKDILLHNRVLDFSFSKPGLGRFRANAYSQRGTFALAIRMLPFDIPKFNTLGLPQTVEAFVHKTKGLFLVTGSTGSGKSTTLASLIDLLNESYNYHVITIEDPIEYLHRHKNSLITQREIGEDADSFASALRSALREDPDVIMVGEMRDAETISIALTAAETGHLVLSTLHTIGAAKSIDRIIDAFPPNQHNQIRSQLATVLEGVVSQHLIPKAKGEGMVLASEVMFSNQAIRNLIREGKHFQIPSIMQTGQSRGMQLMEADLANLCNKGLIDREEVMLLAQDQQLIMQFLSRK